MSALEEYPKTVVLNDGAHLTLRPVAASDEPALGAFRARLDAAERSRVDGVRAEGDALWILAADAARVVGVVGLVRDGAPAEAEVRLALDRDYRGRRLGTWMLLDAVHLASALGIGRLVACVRGDATAELAALRRLDFVDDAGAAGGRRLAKTLHAGWTDF